MNLEGEGRPTEEPTIDDDEPTMLDLCVDTTMEVVERINKYMYSEIVLQRIFAVKEIKYILEEIGYKRVKKEILPLIDEIATDTEPAVRQELLESIPILSSFLVEGKEGSSSDGYKQFLINVLPALTDATSDPNKSVRVSSVESFTKVCHYLKSSDLKEHLFPVIDELVTDKSEEENRIAGASLLNKLAPTYGKDQVLSISLPQIKILSTDLMFRVRKAVASNLDGFATALPPASIKSHLLPIFLSLSKDEIWGVRREAAAHWTDIIQCLDKTDRGSQELVKEYVRLLEDESRWVRSAALEGLGKYIASLPSSVVPDDLLQRFVDMCGGMNGALADNEISGFCAYSFPGVLVTVGASKWQKMRPAFEVLVKDLQWKVRRTLAYSLHEIGAVIGSAEAQKSLVPTLKLFLSDLDEVKIGVIKTFSKILKSLPADQRSAYLSTLKDISSQKDNWRLRLTISEQLDSLSQLFPPEQVGTLLLPILLALLEDDISVIRKETATKVGPMLNRLQGIADKHRQSLITSVVGLSKGKSFRQRQLYVAVCENLVNQIEVSSFSSTFLPALVTLASDKVAVVQISVARLWAQSLSQNPALSKAKQVTTIHNTLKKSKHSDILLFVAPSVVPPPLKLKGPIPEALTGKPMIPNYSRNQGGEEEGGGGGGGGGGAKAGAPPLQSPKSPASLT